MSRSTRTRFALPLLCCISLFFAGIAHAQDDEADTAWHGKLDLGVAVNIGTTDSVTGSLTGEAKKAWDLNEVAINLLAAYGITTINDDSNDGMTDTDSTTADLQLLRLGYKRFLDDLLSERAYWYLDAEGGRNNVQDIEYYALVDTGPGWRVWEAEDAKKNYWDLEIGIGYRYDNYQLPSINDTLEDRSTVNGRLSTDVRKAFEVVEVGADAAFYLPFNLPEAWFARGGAFLDVPLTESWKLGNAVRIEYLNQPPDGADSVNLLLTIALGYIF